MPKSGKRKPVKFKKRRKPLRLELVNPPNFYDAMYESMASEAWALDHLRKPSDYIR
jgi:hypothetical protein